MNHLSVVRVLALGGLLIAGLNLLAGLVALVSTEYEFFTVFAAMAGGLSALSGSVLLLTDKPTRRSRPIDGLAVAILFWVLAPIAMAAPFYLITSEGEPRLLIAIYEAVSNLTTTGHSLVDPSLSMPASILVWRAMLHLIGGVAALTIAVTVFAALNLGGPGIHRSRFFTIPEGSFFTAVAPTLRIMAITLIFLCSLLCFILISGGIAPRDALSASVSALTTGLVNPELAVQPIPGLNPFLLVALVLGLVGGTLGVLLFDDIYNGRPGRVLVDPETISFTGLFFLAAFLAFIAGLPLLSAAGWSLSSISTSGMQLIDPSRLDRLPLVLILFPVLIGGAALSTAGGIKLSRMILLTRRVGAEFRQLGYRGSVQHLQFRGVRQTEESLIGVWVYLVGYIIACVFGILFLSFMDVSFDSAIRITVGAIANAGHILVDQIDSDHPAVILAALLGMILGRLEVIALLPALNPSFWRS
jgi:Trk-type K+ transport system membrane component